MPEVISFRPMFRFFERLEFNPLLPLIGLVQGFALFGLDAKDHMGGQDMDALRLALVAGPTACILTLSRVHWRRDAIFSAVIGLIVGGLGWWLAVGLDLRVLDTPDLGGAFALSMLAFVMIAVAFYEAWRQDPSFPPAHDLLFRHGWNDLLRLLLAGLFTGALWLVLYLWGALFKLIDIRFFADLFGRDWFAWTFSGAAFGTGIAILQEFDSALAAARRLTFALFRFLGAALALAGVLFLCALPFTGLEPLWATRHAASIALWVCLLTLLFANGGVRSRLERSPKRFWRILMMPALVLLPVYGGIALHALYLRIDQYGMTPDRVYALILAVVATLFALVYAGTVVVARERWTEAVAQVNPWLALFAGIVAFVMHLPPLEAFGWSARSQAAILRDGRIAADAFDFGFLKFRLGAPGRLALADLAESPAAQRPEIAAALARLDDIDSLADWWALHNGPARPGVEADIAALRETVAVYPAGAEIPDGLIDQLAGEHRGMALLCRERAENAPPCTLFRLDFTGDGTETAGFWDGYGTVLVFARDGESWRYLRTLTPSGPLAWPDARKALDAQAVETAPPASRDLIIGGTRFE